MDNLARLLFYLYFNIHKFKKMKKILLAMSVTLFSIGVFAQTPMTTAKQVSQSATATKVAKQMPSAEIRATQYSNELKSKLALTDDQYKKVMTVNTECIKRKDAAKASGKDASKDISAYRQQQYQTILTPAQMAKLKGMNVQGAKAMVPKTAVPPVKVAGH